MPIYEYERPDGTTFEVFQAITDAPLTHDPETGVPVRRVFHAPAIHFKGSGFYNTDYGTRRRERERAKEQSAAKEGGEAGKGKDGSKEPALT
jgi:putative FmdB family regulatory protein